MQITPALGSPTRILYQEDELEAQGAVSFISNSSIAGENIMEVPFF
ncbi:hypothetical protein DB42_BD00020 [Neochlamydia sp. EPS4]|nr:hypothetical protein [Neochlamydia sp. EPS4]KIC74454.1 hypothetical protein DB42_BD00020 [Neochlamydia sp. EPS4]